MRAFLRLAKSIFTSPLIVIKSLRATKIDNFLGGILVGALFSLIVNVITVQVQEVVDRQKYLEALEHEIMGHYIQSMGKGESILDLRENNQDANPYSFISRYDTSVWESGNASGYIYDLEPNIQSKVEGYYPYMVFPANRMLDRAEDAVNNLEEDYVRCILEERTDCVVLRKAFDNSANYYEETQLTAVQMVNNSSYELMNEFHPTQDRLDSFVLRIFMGDHAQEILRRDGSEE